MQDGLTPKMRSLNFLTATKKCSTCGKPIHPVLNYFLLFDARDLGFPKGDALILFV